MAFGFAKSLLLLQLSMLFISSFANARVFDDFMIESPSLSPVPAPEPEPDVPSIRALFEKQIIVQGAVHTKSCNYAGWSPVSGATIHMQCNITETPETYEAQTDEKGFFFLQGPESATIQEAHKCKVSLGPCPSDSCDKPSMLRGGASGVFLTEFRIFKSFFLFSVGPWAYEPKCP